MAGELQHITHKHCLTLLGGCPAYPASEVDELTGGFSLEGSQKENFLRLGLGRGRRGKFVFTDVEPGPVYWGWENGIGVPEERSGVSKVAFVVVSLVASRVFKT